MEPLEAGVVQECRLAEPAAALEGRRLAEEVELVSFHPKQASDRLGAYLLEHQHAAVGVRRSLALQESKVKPAALLECYRAQLRYARLSILELARYCRIQGDFDGL